MNDQPIRVMALHALTYCERLFYLEEVEEIRIADAAVFAGRTLHEELRKTEEENGEWTSLELSSEILGLTGKVDCLKRRDGVIIPYEHKKGRSLRIDKKPYAWPADEIQVTAYGMLLEENTGLKVSECRIRYHSENVTVKIPFDEAAKGKVFDAISRAQELRASTERPPITQNDKLCIRCSLAPVCLPEEERLIEDKKWEPLRLFPPDRELKTIHVIDHSAKISRAGDTLTVKIADKETKTFPMREVGSVVIHGYAQMTTQALHLCAVNDIPVHWLSPGQRYITGTSPGAGMVQRKIRQYQALTDKDKCIDLTRKLVTAKIETSIRYILRATRGLDRKKNDLEQHISIMRKSLKSLSSAKGIDEMRGHEGMAGKAYFASLPTLIRDEIPDEMRFLRRSRRPPKDRFNALLGYGYALLYGAVFQAVVAVGLEPALGFYHKPRSASHPLVLDLMELFRIPLWDMCLIGSINRLQWDPEDDFVVSPGKVWLSGPGRRKAVQLFEERLSASWKHPVIQYSLSYARLVELEIRLLEKEWTGSPGLFAKMRLR